MSTNDLTLAHAAIWRSECALQGASVFMSAPSAQFQGTSVSAFGSGAGTGTVMTVSVPRVRPEFPPQGLELKGHGQPATKQHAYINNCNPAVDGTGAVNAAGPPHREPV